MMLKSFFILACFVVALPSWAKVYSESEIIGKKVQLSKGLRLYSSAKQGAKTFTLQSSGKVKILESTESRNRTYFKIEISGEEYFVRDDDLTEAGILDCQDCSSGGKSSNTDDLKAVAKKTKKNKKGKAVAFQSLWTLAGPNGPGYDPLCAGFVQKDGAIGAWGRQFLDEAAKVQIGKLTAIDYLKDVHLWKNICPSFKGFSDDQKEHYIATFLGVKAMDEANCNPNSYKNSSDMPNPPGVGFFMLEGRSGLRRGRHPTYCGGGYKGTQETLPKDLQFRCAAYQMVASQFMSIGPFCGGRKGYWQEANSTNGDICNSMRGYKACFE